MFRFPKNPRDCAEAAQVLGSPPSERQKIVDDPRKYCTAPWHYSSRHRVRDQVGKWRLRREPSHRDSDGKAFSFPPPNGNIQQFIDEENLSSGLCRGEYNNFLPDWVRVLDRLQRDSGENPAPVKNNNESSGAPPRNAIRTTENNLYTTLFRSMHGM